MRIWSIWFIPVGIDQFHLTALVVLLYIDVKYCGCILMKLSTMKYFIQNIMITKAIKERVKSRRERLAKEE